MIVLRQHLGDALRRRRTGQGRTLREVSSAARVSLGYLSEVERGQKEPSSELLGAICGRWTFRCRYCCATSVTTSHWPSWPPSLRRRAGGTSSRLPDRAAS